MAAHNTTFEVSSMTQLDNNSNVKALANVVINGEIAVNGVKVMEGEKGLFVAMPSKKVGGEFVDIGCLDGLAAVARQVSIAEVVGKDEDDVGAVRCSLGSLALCQCGLCRHERGSHRT